MTKKRKHRRYKLVWPYGQNAGKKKTAGKGHRRIRRSALIGIIVIAVGIVCLMTVPKAVETNHLKKLGYTSSEITAIRNEKLTKTILKTGYYSAYLAASIKDGTVNTDYLDLYTVVSKTRGLSDTDFLLVNRLKDRGYEEDQILNLFKNLRFWEITPLLVFDYQYDESKYIADCQKNASTNSQDNFVLDNNYYTLYGDTLPVDNPGDLSMLVNKTYYLGADYVPPNLTTLSTVYAAQDRQLAQVAADALKEWCDAGIKVGVRFYAASAYRSYDSQTEIYNGYVSSMGQEKTDAISARPGFSEHQTGYVVDVAAVGESDHPEYKDTNAYQWTSANSADYGWILRYPEGKTSITGYDFESWHYRYLGKELATAVYNSKLTYDEFYALYLKPWDNEANKPSEAILSATDYRSASQSTTSGS